MIHSQPYKGVTPRGGGGVVQFCRKKSNSAKNYENSSEKLYKFRYVSEKCLVRTPLPQQFWENKYSFSTEMSIEHELCQTLLVWQNKLIPHPVVIPKLRPCNHDDLHGTIWKSRFNSSGEEVLFYK
jgi:hypothetical protein